MTEFEYASGLVSIVVDLAIERVLDGMHADVGQRMEEENNL